MSRSELARGYEIAPGRYVEVADEDLAALAPEHSKTIDIEQFVSRKELDPIYFDAAYYVVPDLDRVRPFALLLRVLQETNRAAVCWFVLRSKRHLAAVQPRANLMLLTTLMFADEIVAVEGLEPLLPPDLSPREVEMAELLVNTLSGPFEPQRYRDEYQERLLELVHRKSRGEATVVPEPAAPTSGVEDLMAALARSIEQARAEHPPRRKRRGA